MKVVHGICILLMICMYCTGCRNRADVKDNGICIVAADSQEMYTIQLERASTGETSYERMNGESLRVSGRKDTIRGYFEGSISWEGEAVHIVDLSTMESVLLEEKLTSFVLGDYYVVCSYDSAKKEAGLLIFYCPVP